MFWSPGFSLRPAEESGEQFAETAQADFTLRELRSHPNKCTTCTLTNVALPSFEEVLTKLNLHNSERICILYLNFIVSET